MKKMIIISLILFICIIYLILVLKYQYRINNDYTIQQVNNPNYLIIENLIESRSPTVITGWLTPELLDTFNLDNLIKVGSDDMITIKKTIAEQEKTILLDMTLKKYIELIKNNNSLTDNYYWSEDLEFIRKHNLDNNLHSFFSNYFQNTHLFSSTALWVGPNNSKTGLHYDKDHINLLCQVSGKKRIYLFSPSQIDNLYPSDKYDPGALLSNVNFWNQDLQKYPLFKKANYVEIILHPGQILLIPPYWWHCIENIDINVAISYRIETPFSLITKIPDISKLILHKCGLYQNKNCICCN